MPAPRPFRLLASSALALVALAAGFACSSSDNAGPLCAEPSTTVKAYSTPLGGPCKTFDDCVDHMCWCTNGQGMDPGVSCDKGVCGWAQCDGTCAANGSQRDTTKSPSAGASSGSPAGADASAASPCQPPSSGGGSSNGGSTTSSSGGSTSSSGGSSGSSSGTSGSSGSSSGGSSGSTSSSSSSGGGGSVTCTSSGDDSCYCMAASSGNPPNATTCGPSALPDPGECCASAGWPQSGSCECNAFLCYVNQGGGRDCMFNAKGQNGLEVPTTSATGAACCVRGDSSLGHYCACYDATNADSCQGFPSVSSCTPSALAPCDGLVTHGDTKVASCR